MEFYCPNCKELQTISVELVACSRCERRFRHSAGVFDLVMSDDREEEREFYNREYASSRRNRKNLEKVSIDSVAPQWQKPESPQDRTVLEELGDIEDETVLLLGNGESIKEMLFLERKPRTLVYSDLSPEALVNIEARFNLADHQDRIIFAAIDAQNIPFAQSTFDVVYAYAMVHHLPDLDKFFASVMSVLKPGGRAIFMDDAFSPIWHYSKQSWLKPLMKRSHRTTGISPEDYRFSMSGGFKESDLRDKLIAAGGEPWFRRTAFLTYVFYRGAEKLLPVRLNKAVRHRSIARFVRAIDRAFCALPIFERNQVRLIWGLRKPGIP